MAEEQERLAVMRYTRVRFLGLVNLIFKKMAFTGTASLQVVFIGSEKISVEKNL